MKKMTKTQAQKKLLELCKKGIRWYDQFQGHGHYEFHLEALEFFDMFEILKLLDGIEKKSRKRKAGK